MYSVHGKICTLLKLHFRRYPLENRSERKLNHVTCYMSVQKKKWKVQLRKQKPFCKASATFIGRLICLDMQGYQWMENTSWFFLTLWHPTLNEALALPPHTLLSFFFENHLCRRKKESFFFCSTDPCSKRAVFTVFTKNVLVTLE